MQDSKGKRHLEILIGEHVIQQPPGFFSVQKFVVLKAFDRVNAHMSATNTIFVEGATQAQVHI